MYPYHNRIKQRIRPGIGPALVLVFNTSPFLRPIRPHKWDEYKEVIKCNS